MFAQQLNRYKKLRSVAFSLTQRMISHAYILLNCEQFPVQYRKTELTQHLAWCENRHIEQDRKDFQTLKRIQKVSARWRFIAHLQRKNGNYKTNIIIKHTSSWIVQALELYKDTNFSWLLSIVKNSAGLRDLCKDAV